MAFATKRRLVRTYPGGAVSGWNDGVAVDREAPTLHGREVVEVVHIARHALVQGDAAAEADARAGRVRPAEDAIGQAVLHDPVLVVLQGGRVDVGQGGARPGLAVAVVGL